MISNNPYIIPVPEQPFRPRESTYSHEPTPQPQGPPRNENAVRLPSPNFINRSHSINARDQPQPFGNHNGHHIFFNSDNRSPQNYGGSEYSQPNIRDSNINIKRTDKKIDLHEQHLAILNGRIEQIFQHLQGHRRKIQTLWENRNNSKRTGGDESNQNISINSQPEIISNSFVTPWDGNFKSAEQITSYKSELTKLRNEMAKSASEGKRNHDEMLYQFKKQLLHKFGEEASKQKKTTQDFLRKQQLLANTKMAEIQSELKNIDEKIRLSQKNTKVKMSGNPSISAALTNELDSLKKQVESIRQKTDLQAHKSGGRFLRLEQIQVSTERSNKNTVLVSYEEYFKVMKKNAHQGQREIKITERQYYIDSQGYLLDAKSYYLLDSSNSRIHLSQKQLNSMKEKGILT